MSFREISIKGRRFKLKKRTWKYYGKWTLILFLVYFVYLIAGALLPFVKTKETKGIKRNLYEELAAKRQDGSGDRASILETNQDALDMRLYTISQAKQRVVISTFDIRPGESWDAMGSALLAAAERQVKVQILVDGIFGQVHMGGKDEFYALGTHENVEIKYYNPVNLLKPWKFNGRLHDKYVLVDDRYLILGGRNIFDYFLGEFDGESKGYDRDVFIYNTSGNSSIIREMDAYFQDIWGDRECKTKFSKKPFFRKEKIESQTAFYRQHAWAESISSMSEETVFDSTVRIDAVVLSANPTHVMNKEPWVWDQMADLMEGADSRVVIQTPYAVFSKPMQNRLNEVVEAVPHVEMVLNSIAVGDNVMASSDYMKRRKDVLETGVLLREYHGNHSMHAKSILIDDDISIIGSYNLDMRSTYIDTETMLVIQGEEFNQLLEEQMEIYRRESLVVKEDGSYEMREGIEVKEIPEKKRRMLRVISFFTPVFRYLI